MQTDLNWPKQSTTYCEGFDDNGQWLPGTAYQALHEQGSIVDLGQIGPFVKRLLDRLVKDGSLVKYRGHWDTLLPRMGMGPLKTIWATPEVHAAAIEMDNGIAACLARAA